MSNHSLKPLTPLGSIEPSVDQIGEATIIEIVDQNLASIAVREGQQKPFATAAKKALNLKLPDPGQSTTKGNYTVFWTGPEQWFVEAPEVSHDDIAGILKAEFKETASITEQTGGWCRYDLKGASAIGVLERLCPNDTATMDKGNVARSIIEHIGVNVLCRVKTTHFSLYGPRSSAGSLHHALTAAAKSIV